MSGDNNSRYLPGFSPIGRAEILPPLDARTTAVALRQPRTASRCRHAHLARQPGHQIRSFVREDPLFVGIFAQVVQLVGRHALAVK